jgi:thioredoxin reductase
MGVPRVAAQLPGCQIDDTGSAVKDGTGQTTVSGVWIAGNLANPRAQVITAAGEGSAAAMAINADLVDQDVRDSVKASNLGF